MKSDIDAVLIASSTNTHANISKLAAKHGKGILCEKPIDLNLKKAQAVCDIVKNSDVPNMVDFNRRFDASHSALKQALIQQKAGNIEIIQITARDQSPPLLEYAKVSGGQMRDQVIHFFDLLCYLSDDYPVEIFVMGDTLINKDFKSIGEQIQLLLHFECHQEHWLLLIVVDVHLVDMMNELKLWALKQC